METPADPRLEEVTGFLALAALLLTLLHLRAARAYRGCRRGAALALRVVVPTFASAALLLAAVLALLTLYFHRLLSAPTAAGSKNELVVVAAAVAALVYSGLVGCDRRRRTVAVRLASIPCFGNGEHAASHQLLAVEKDPMLCFVPQFIAPESPGYTMSTTSSTASLARALKTGLENNEEKHVSNTAGITRRRVWEISCRTACTWVFGRPKRQAWPLNVVRTYRTKGKRFVLIKDETVQDGAGAVLLEPSFTQSRELDKHLIGRVVHRALYRAAPCVLRSWNSKFGADLFQRFAQLPSVICMLTGEIRQDIQRRASRKGGDNDERCYVTELLWATIMVEVLDYLQYKRRDLPLLTWLVQLPQWLCHQDAGKIDREIDAVFETWTAGRSCGKYLTRPCDSECCCHNSFSQTGCGCLCPCVCSCP